MKIEFKDGSKIDAMLIGIQIKSQSDLSDLRIRIDGVTYVSGWAISSDGMSQEDVNELVRELPKGLMKEGSIFASIPRMMTNSKTTIHLRGLVSSGFDCSKPWFLVSAPQRKIWHGEYASMLQLRDAQFGVWFNPYKFLLMIAIIVILFEIFTKRKRKAIKRKPSPRSPRRSD